MQPREILGEAWALYKAHWRHFLPIALVVIVLTVLVLIVVAILLAIVLAILLAWLPDEVRGYIQTLVSNTLTAPFLALAWTLLYFRLRELERPPEPAPLTA